MLVKNSVDKYENSLENDDGNASLFGCYRRRREVMPIRAEEERSRGVGRISLALGIYLPHKDKIERI